MNDWDGFERRKTYMNDKDHDLLIKIGVSFEAHISKFEDSLILIKENLDKYNKKVDFQQRIIYGIIGVFVFLNFISKFIK